MSMSKQVIERIVALPLLNDNELAPIIDAACSSNAAGQIHTQIHALVVAFLPPG